MYPAARLRWLHYGRIDATVEGLRSAGSLEKEPDLLSIRGYVEDSGKGRWAVLEAIDQDVPAPVLVLSLLMRLRSRQADSFGAKTIAALRNEFGGHAVKPKA